MDTGQATRHSGFCDGKISNGNTSVAGYRTAMDLSDPRIAVAECIWPQQTPPKIATAPDERDRAGRWGSSIKVLVEKGGLGICWRNYLYRA
jgi:hypothetical protein